MRNGHVSVLVAYDGSPCARRALDHAATLAGPGSRVTVVNVIEEQSVSSRLQTVSDEQRARQRRLLGEAESILSRRGIVPDAVGAAGDRVGEILAAVELTGADLLVVGCDGSRHVLHRSISAVLARKAACDVLVVH
jgi:nucleotide-binding universal stress UspA family protein